MKKIHQGDNPFNNLVVLEMANNHMGDLNHGLKMIQEFAEVVKPYKDKINKFSAGLFMITLNYKLLKKEKKMIREIRDFLHLMEKGEK